ncbi:MAG: hypothetical protein K2Q18_05010 [Bdellovibrionales bacterium]|nr:hypothetical protein [Bdellovibrionales bacterium]
MKKAIFLILTGIIGAQVAALADVEQAKMLTPLQKTQIAWALKILGETKTLSMNQNQCVQLDEDIMSVLEAEGHIQRSGTHPTTICVGASGITK